MIPSARAPSDGAPSLALALVAASSAPVLLLDGALNVIAASASFGAAFAVDPVRAAGRPLAQLGGGEWAGPELAALIAAARAGPAAPRLIDLAQDGAPARPVTVSVARLDHDDQDDVRLLLTVADLGEARRLADKDAQLQALQHRIANTLQIVASVLLQSARSAGGDGARQRLLDAHSRVMSVATLQQQAAGGDGEVRLRPYLTDLCASIGASMMDDGCRIALVLDVDDQAAPANTATRLGLLITELAINAVRHAFPQSRSGVIRIDCHGQDPDWTVTVADDGVGMSKTPIASKSGLGASMIAAVSRQLGAVVTIADAAPGVIVSVAPRQRIADVPQAPSIN